MSDNNPTALELAGQCAGYLEDFCDQLRGREGVASLLDNPGARVTTCERLARVRRVITTELAEIRKTLGLKET